MLHEYVDCQIKLGMILSANMQDPKQVVALDIMLMKGRGYQAKDIEEKGEWLCQYADYSYRTAIGHMIDTYMPEVAPYSYTDVNLLDAIADLHYSQQVVCAENIMERLFIAERMFESMVLATDSILTMREQGLIMIAACEEIIAKWGVKKS